MEQADFLRILRGVQAVRSKCAEVNASNSPERATIPGVGLMISAGNAGCAIPLVLSDRVCAAIEIAITLAATEAGVDVQ